MTLRGVWPALPLLAALAAGCGSNLGQVEARAIPQGADVEFAEDTCRVRVHSLGEVLIVADNSECGGMNVRFNGVYRRAGKR